MSGSKKILIVDDEEFVRRSLRELCEGEGYDVLEAGGGVEASRLLREREAHVVVTDLRMPDGDGMSLLEEARSQGVGVPIILLTGFGKVSDAVGAIRKGAFDFIEKPVDADRLMQLIRRALSHGEMRSELQYLKSTVAELRAGERLVGDSSAMRELRSEVAQVGPSNSTVLIHGESGTGKELVAADIHRSSSRAEKNIVWMNCSAVPEALFESELFGHRRGAFSGAVADRIGRFQEADGGTLVLDEVGTLKPEMQAKLLRVIETGDFQVVGESQSRVVDVRLVAVTNEDLREKTEKGEFRDDLFYRLNVYPIRVPALREHKEDLLQIADHLLARLEASDPGIRGHGLDEGCERVLMAYDWPGNVRELRNVLERAAIACGVDAAIAPALLERILESTSSLVQSEAAGEFEIRSNLNALEKRLVAGALERTGGHKKEAAGLLGIDARNLGYYLKKHDLQGSRARP